MSEKSIQLGNKVISNGSDPYVIAEIGVNHEGSLERARNLIRLAKEGGADAAKFQAYKADTLASKHSPAYWDTAKEPTLSQHELFKKYDSFGEKEYKNLADHCREIDIDFVSTPFDDAAIEFLDPLVPFFKIASADITNIPLLRKVAGKGKPVVLSTGASTLAEVDTALEALSHSGCSEVGLLHCVLNYPTAYENAHVGMISGLERAYPELVIGYSDHTLPDDTMFVLTLAYLKGARIIEKHFTDDKRLPGNDHYHAMDVNDLRVFRQNIDKIRTLTGSDHKHPLPSEAQSRLHARRSIVLKKDVLRGTALTESMIICKRPSHGISPVHWDAVLGRKAARDLKEDSVLQWEDLTR